MKRHLFKADKNVYKANMHCHTTVSDGALTPQQIKEKYKSAGYSIVAFTDHDVLENHSYLNDTDFLAINACEMEIVQTSQKLEKSKVYHLNLYSQDSDRKHTPPLPEMDYDDIDSINQYIKARASEGFLVCYNHPYWSLQTYEDYSKLRGLFAMEIYNHNCEVGDGYCGYHPQVYSEMLRSGGKIFCLSTDDNHNWVDDSFGGYIMINAASLQYSDIIDALERGDFYSSQGPEIHEISILEKKLRVCCSPVELIVVYTDSRVSYFKQESGITEAEFELSGREEYIRVMCRDKEKRDANSNGCFIG